MKLSTLLDAGIIKCKCILVNFNGIGRYIYDPREREPVDLPDFWYYGEVVCITESKDYNFTIFVKGE